jgi:hypothetical protein
MKALTALALLSGCNSVFGNDRVTASPLIDAQFFDTKLDAPPACPAGLPRFRPDLYDVETDGTCFSYSVAEDGTVLALCKTDDAAPAVLEAGSLVIGVPMTMALNTITTNLPTSITLLGVRLAPEGDFALVRFFDSTVVIHALRNVGGTWTDEGEVPIPPQDYYSTPSRGPTRHLLEWTQASNKLVELVGDGTSWSTAMAAYVPAGFESISGDFGLTPDGLRMVAVTGATGVLGSVPRYGARSDLSSPFTTATTLDEPTTITQPFLTNDCDALFFIGLDRLLYVKQ